MLRNNIFPNSETKIKKVLLGEARALSGSFGIFEIVRVVFSQSARAEMKKSAFLSPKKEHFIGYRYHPFKVRSPVADEIWSAKFELGLNLMNFDVFRFGNGTAMPLDEA